MKNNEAHELSLRRMRKLRRKLTGATVSEVMRACGAGERTAHRLLKGEPVPDRVANELWVNYNRRTAGTLQLHMEGIEKLPPRARDNIISRLTAVAELLETHYRVFRLPSKAKDLWLFPPRKVLRDLGCALDACLLQLKHLHEECPEYDPVLFRNTPWLLDYMDRVRNRKQTGRKQREKAPEEN